MNFKESLTQLYAAVVVAAILVVAAAGQATGTHASGAKGAPVSRAGTAPASADPINQVDFANFSYPSGCSDGGKDSRFPAVITVVKGGWQGPQSDEGTVSYSVDPPVYGQLLGGSAVQAVISADCFLGNGDLQEVFIYGMSGGQPKLIQRLDAKDWAPDGEWFDMTKATIRNDRLLVTYNAGGSHAQPAWSVTRTMTWNGRKFVAGAATRKPYKP